MSQDVDPESKYGIIAESLRQSFPEAKTCSMFCGGKKCKYCDPEASPIWSKDQKVIKGLFSNWCVVLTVYFGDLNLALLSDIVWEISKVIC